MINRRHGGGASRLVRQGSNKALEIKPRIHASATWKGEHKSGINQTDDSGVTISVAPTVTRRRGPAAPRGVVSAALDTRFRGHDGEVHAYQLLERYHWAEVLAVGNPVLEGCSKPNRRSSLVRVASIAHRHLSKDLTSEPQAGPIVRHCTPVPITRRSRDQLQ